MLSEPTKSNSDPDATDGKGFLLALGLPIAVIAYFVGASLPYAEDASPTIGGFAVAVTGLTAWCWLTRCLPLAPASLIPLALFPFLGVRSTADAAAAYAHPILWLFFGGFILAMAIERWGLHRRLALHIIARLGL